MPGSVFRLAYGVHPRATPGKNWFMDFDTLDGKGGLNWRTKKPLGEFTCVVPRGGTTFDIAVTSR